MTKTVTTPISDFSDFIEQSPSFTALKEQVDALTLQVEIEKANAAGWEEAFNRASKSGSATIQARADEIEVLNRTVDEMNDEIAKWQSTAGSWETKNRRNMIERGTLVTGIEAAIKLQESNLNPDLTFQLMSTLLTGLIREVGEA